MSHGSASNVISTFLYPSYWFIYLCIYLYYSLHSSLVKPIERIYRPCMRTSHFLLSPSVPIHRCSLRLASRCLVPSCRVASFALHTSRAWSSTTPPSAVNVEAFTLNEEVVRRDLEHLAKWNDLSSRIDSARQAKDYALLLKEAMSGIQLLKEIGADNAPVLCEPHLHLEAAQACVQLKECEAGITHIHQALNVLNAASEEHRDRATIAECEVLEAHILTVQGKGAEAVELLKKVMQWIQVDAKQATPVQAVAALHLRRTAQTAMGCALIQQARVLADDQVAEKKQFFSSALDTLIDALNEHIDEKDSPSVKLALENIFYCFEGIGDMTQAATTSKKYVSWCSRHEDEAGVKFGHQLLDDLCQRHQLEKEKLIEKNE